MKILKITAYTAVVIWGLIGILVAISTAYSNIGFFINIFMSVLFMAIAYFLYVKAKNNLAMLQIQTDNNYKKTQKQFFRIELLFFTLSLLFGLLLLSGAISRVLYEKMAVFG